MMNKFKLFLIICFSLLVGSLVSATKTKAAHRLILDPTSVTVKSGDDFTIKLSVNAESTPVFGADAVLIFPSYDFDFKSAENGGFFSDFSAAPSTGKVELHGFFSSLFESKSGQGVFANLKFNAKGNSGFAEISFICSGSNNTTQILDANGNNILTCSLLNKTAVAFASRQGEPNSCGGTCGSNYNCKAELFCYQGFCRNAFCQTQTNCVCPTPTPSPTPIPRPTLTPTPQVITLTEYSSPAPSIPSPTTAPTTSPTPTEKGSVLQALKSNSWFRGILIALVPVTLFLILRAIIKAGSAKSRTASAPPPAVENTQNPTNPQPPPGAF